MTFEVKGLLHEIFDIQQISDTFRKREFVLEIQDGMYPQYVKFQLIQDKSDLINDFSKGDEVNVFFNLRGKAYEKNGSTMYFTNLDAWRVTGASAAQPTANTSAPVAEEGSFPSATDDPGESEHSDDLPF